MYLIKGAKVVNEGSILELDVLIRNGRIDRIGSGINVDENVKEIKKRYLT